MTARLLEVRPAGRDVDRRILADDVLEVEPAERPGQHVGADVVAADELDVVADIALAGRIAALAGHAGVRLEKDLRTLEAWPFS